MGSLLVSPASGACVEEAYAHCARLAQTHYENFTIVSWLLPRDKRPHLHAIYAFCRTTDDLGDEAPGDRLNLLNQWEADLLRCYQSRPHHPALIALQHTIHSFDIPREPFLKLIQANRMDQQAARHPTYRHLLSYCDHSANPVGHMVLYVFGYRDGQRQRLSDATCTGLQLANFWQDVRRDYARGRIYLPQEDMERFGYTEDELARGVANDAFRALMHFEVERARGLFQEGVRLVDTVRGRLKLDLALFTLGGMHILRAIERQGYDVLSRRPTLSRPKKLWLIASTAARLGLRGRLA